MAAKGGLVADLRLKKLKLLIYQFGGKGQLGERAFEAHTENISKKNGTSGDRGRL